MIIKDGDLKIGDLFYISTPQKNKKYGYDEYVFDEGPDVPTPFYALIISITEDVITYLVNGMIGKDYVFKKLNQPYSYYKHFDIKHYRAGKRQN